MVMNTEQPEYVDSPFAHGGHVKLRNLQNLLNRAAAALETPKDLTPKERVELIEDLLHAAQSLKT